MPRRFTPGRRRIQFLVLAAIAVLSVAALPATAANGGSKTSVPSMLDPVMAGVQIVPLLTVGEAVGDEGYVFDSIPDGISIDLRGKGRVDAYVNHETSLVPFPGNISDFNNSQVSRIALNQNSKGVLNAKYVVTSDSNYQRFCSNFLAGPAQGFDRQILFTNEEATDVVNRVGTAWPATPANPASKAEQAGVVVALDIKSGEHRPIYGMGRHNHENSVAIPGYDDLVILSGDDTFTAPASQLYSYIAPDTDAVWNDEGALWAFKSDIATINDYGDLSGNASVSGTFIEVPRAIATGLSTPLTAQTELENWSNTNNVFQFIRVEDIAYDRNDPSIVYFADTGEPRAVASTTTTRLARGSATTTGPYPNGRIFKMVLDPEDPKVVLSLSILIDADAGGYTNRNVIHQPDNIETTANGILIQEDPGTHNHGNDGPTGSTARIWHYDFSDTSLDVVAKVNQSLDETPGYDVDTSAAARPGAWESSGIVDASAAFGPDWFLVDVQAGSLTLESVPSGAVVFEREGGQFLAIKIPGA
jgi:hypothetical protein